MPVVLLIVAIDMMGFGIIIPMLPFYAEHYGANPQEVTFLMVAFSLLQFVTAPLWGGLSDRYGRRPVLLLTLAGSITAYVLLAVVDSFAALIAARAFAGAMAGNLAVAQAYIADVTGPEGRTRGMGQFGAALSLGFVAGPAIGGLLAGPDPVSANFEAPAVAAAAVSALALALTMACLREPISHGSRKRWRGRLSILGGAFVVPFLGGLVVLSFGTVFVFAGMEATFALWSERVLAWGPAQNGYLFAAASLGVAVLQGGFAGKVARMIGDGWMALLGIAFLGAGMGGIALSGSFTPLLPVAITLLVFGFGFSSPALASLISAAAEAGRGGAVFGVSQSAASLARIAGPAFAGAGFHHVGIAWPYAAGAACTVVMFAGAYILFRKHRAIAA